MFRFFAHTERRVYGGVVEQKGQLLARVPLFAGVTAAGIEELGAIADEVEVRPGTVLTHQGYREGYFFIVVEGTVRIERDGQTIASLGPGEFLGEIALLDAGPRTATAIAEDTRSPALVELRDVPRAAWSVA
jgi:CRP-like cAMP-binding protein